MPNNVLGMTDFGTAFSNPIKDGKARILLRVQEIRCEVINNAPDFIETEQDDVSLRIELPNQNMVVIPELDQSFSLNLDSQDNEIVVFKLDSEYIWFDINIDHIKDVWVADLNFVLESKNSRYLAYYIKELDHQFEWLQTDMKSGEVKTMSISKKRYKIPKISGKETFSVTEVIRCADMLNRSIKKIDLRIGGAYVKYNTDKGKLEPLIMGIADQLGYVVEQLPKNIVYDMETNDRKVSHSIFLKDRTN